jgi:hypothetical protein
MKAKTTLFLGLLVLAVPCVAENTGCHEWNQLGEVGELGKAARIYFLSGFQEGMQHGLMQGVIKLTESGVSVSKALVWRTDTFGIFAAPVANVDTIKGINAICARPENSLILVYDAMQAFIMQVKGKQPSEIEAFLARARQVAIQTQDSDKPNK